MRLLLIEDEQRIGNPLKKTLERHKYAVDYVTDGSEGYQMAKINSYDCLILDLNLPGMDGLEVARQLRANNVNTPILMLTSRTNQENVIEGFENGTDDYMMKPFNLSELLLRINAMIKRNNLNKSTLLTARQIMVDTQYKKAFLNNQEIKLNAKEYGILEYLLRNKNRTVSQEELLEHVWGREIDCFTQTVRTNIKTLRQKIDPHIEVIITIKGSGYEIK